MAVLQYSAVPGAADSTPEQEKELYKANESELLSQLQSFHCFCTPCYDEEEADFSSTFQKDLLRDRAYWTGNLAVDYGFHVANAHPLLSCCFSHPAHPYNKLERIAVLIIVSCMTFPPTFALLRGSRGTSQTKQAKETAGLWSEVIAWEQFFARLGTQLSVLLLVTVPSLVVQFLLESLAVLDFQLQEGSVRCSNCKPFCIFVARCVVQIKQSCLICSFAVAALVYYVSATSFAREGDGMVEAFVPFLTSRAQSWTLWFLLDGFMPCCGFLARWCAEDTRSPAKFRRKRNRSRDLGGRRASRESLRAELSSAMDDLARKREEAALLQWRIHHLEVELMELERAEAGLSEPMGLDSWETPRSLDTMVQGSVRLQGWQTS